MDSMLTAFDLGDCSTRNILMAGHIKVFANDPLGRAAGLAIFDLSQQANSYGHLRPFDGNDMFRAEHILRIGTITGRKYFTRKRS
jgi:hypothetical protein